MARKTKPTPELPVVGRVVGLKVLPFVKWVGGKSRLNSTLQQALPPGFENLRHIEPFIGGGALFFALSPARAILTDTNPDLINAYVQVKNNVEALIENLTFLKAEHSKEHYYDARELFNTVVFDDPTLRAAVFIYLNKSCFNGLWRQNKKGEFNVPMGDYKAPNICDADTLRRCSAVLHEGSREIACCDFSAACDIAREGDFVYLDPPYDDLEEAESFTGYSPGGFDKTAQARLAKKFREMDAAGAKLLLSNHDTPFIRELYKGYEIVSIEAPRSVGATTRAPAPEVLVMNYADPLHC